MTLELLCNGINSYNVIGLLASKCAGVLIDIIMCQGLSNYICARVSRVIRVLMHQGSYLLAGYGYDSHHNIVMNVARVY